MSIRIAIVGVGNCASALVQGIKLYSLTDATDGLMMAEIEGYRVRDIEVVAAFDVTAPKVGAWLDDALVAPPNNTAQMTELCGDYDIRVRRGPTLDGLGTSLRDMVEESAETPADVTAVLESTHAEIVVSYLPVGSEAAAVFYASEALRAGCAFINCMPAFIASGKHFPKLYEDARLPLIGDDVKSQLGATAVHRALAALFRDRGVRLRRTSQLNVGGNADFYNMLDRDRLQSKRISKTQAVVSVFGHPLAPSNVHIGPSDYVPWLEDRKWAHIRLEGEGFSGSPITVELKLEVQDSPNSAGVVVDAIRCARVALDRGLGGVLEEAAAWLMKSPPKQAKDERRALEGLERWLNAR